MLQYFLPFAAEGINKLIEEAILRADRIGVKVISLAALNKASLIFLFCFYFLVSVMFNDFRVLKVFADYFSTTNIYMKTLYYVFLASI